MTEHVRAELHRSGGFTGRRVSVRLDSEQMPPADAARLLQLVSTIDLSRLGSEHPLSSGSPERLPATGGADLMRYELTIERGGRRWRGVVSDPHIPAELRPLLQFLSQHS